MISEIPKALERLFRDEGIPDSQVAALVSPYSQIVASLLVVQEKLRGKPMLVGLSGCQGSGKSTMACLLKKVLSEELSLSVAVLSLDDFYFTRHERARLAREVHPLLQTRGVPGTHDIELMTQAIAALFRARSETITRLPRFDKATDDRVDAGAWESFKGPAGIVILEGWCVGAVSQRAGALAAPVNDLERVDDRDGRWRRYVNAQLGARYRALFELLDVLVMLRAPAFEVVFEWRGGQEQKLKASVVTEHSSTQMQAMDDEGLRRFIMHFERLTRHMLSEMPERADLVVALDSKRQIEAVVTRGKACLADSG